MASTAYHSQSIMQVKSLDTGRGTGMINLFDHCRSYFSVTVIYTGWPKNWHHCFVRRNFTKY